MEGTREDQVEPPKYVNAKHHILPKPKSFDDEGDSTLSYLMLSIVLPIFLFHFICFPP